MRSRDLLVNIQTHTQMPAATGAMSGEVFVDIAQDVKLSDAYHLLLHILEFRDPTVDANPLRIEARYHFTDSYSFTKNGVRAESAKKVFFGDARALTLLEHLVRLWGGRIAPDGSEALAQFALVQTHRGPSLYAPERWLLRDLGMTSEDIMRVTEKLHQPGVREGCALLIGDIVDQWVAEGGMKSATNLNDFLGSYGI